MQREVEAGSAARRDAMRRVPGEEDAGEAPALGELRARREPARAAEPNGQVGHPRCEPDELDRPRLVARRIVEAAEQPAVRRARRDEDARNLRVGDRVDRVAVLAGDVPQGRVKERRHPLHEPVRADHPYAERAADCTAGAIGCHHVAGVHRPNGPCAGVAEVCPHAVRVREQAGQLSAELDARVRRGAQVLEQQRLDVVLGDAGGRRRAEHSALLGVRVAHGERRAGGGVGERLGLEHVPVDVRTARTHVGLEPPRPHELHRAQAEDGGARVRGELGPALDEEAGDVMPGQLDGGGEAGWAGPDHQDGGLL